MSQLKVLRGDSSRIGVDVTPFDDGCIYFAQDTGAVYIDAVVDGEQKRVCISSDTAASRTVSATLESSGWVDGEQTITVESLSFGDNGFITVAADATTAEVEAVKDAYLRCVDNNDGTLTIIADGVVPACDIPVTITIF